MSLVLFEKKESIGKITLNNPDQLNAMTEEMGNELAALVIQINQDPEIRVVLITGAGKAFSAGGNLQFILDRTKKTPEQNKKEMIEFYSKFLSLKKIEVPTLAVINGPAIGAGFCIALACDLRLASKEAKMGVNFSKIGLSSGMGALFSLTQLGGSAIAAELLFTGKTITADEAFHMKLVNQVIESSDLEKTAQALAKHISANAPIALKIMKQGLQKAATATLEEVFDYESGGQAITFQTEDLKEGIQAIQEKRIAKFSGK